MQTIKQQLPKSMERLPENAEKATGTQKGPCDYGF